MGHLLKTLTVTSGIIAGVTLLGTYLYRKWLEQKVPKNWRPVAKVKKLYLYPLKSGNRIELNRANVLEFGLKQTEQDEKLLQLHDRSLVVYGEKDNEFRTARTYPKMLTIDVSVHDDQHLAIDAPTMRTLYVAIPELANPIQIKCWNGEKIEGFDCGNEAALWLSRYIIERDSGLRLAYNNLNKRRDLTKTHKKLLDFYKNLDNNSTGLFSDLSSLHLINQSSVDDMNKKIANSNTTSENFRPNIIVDGTGLEPYEEDNWEWIRIGDEVVLRNVKPCTRCIMTTISQNGVRNTNREPLKTLEKYRMNNGPEKAPVMGVNLAVKRTGSIKHGDIVYVPEK